MPFKIFFDNDRRFYRFKDDLYRKIRQEITAEQDDYILNVGEVAYIESLRQKYSWSFPRIDFNQKFIDSSDHKKALLCIPFDGDIELLLYFPTTWNSGGVALRVQIEGNYIVYDVTNYPPNLRGSYIDNYIDSISDNYQHLKNDFDETYDSLESGISEIFGSHKQTILNQRKSLAQMGIPIRKRDESSSIIIPKPEMRKKIELKPQVIEKGYVAEPAVGDTTYLEILKTINDTGKAFENTPSVYKGKGEEDLRDHILLVLSPTFQVGTATGETFNKKGKTDILLSYQTTTVFVAECKFWRGPEGYLKTIDQLLSYLTWRNSKTSIVVFVDNVSMTNVINQISTLTQSHPNYIREEPKQDETWFNFTMNLPSDNNKELKMAVQLFHLPA